MSVSCEHCREHLLDFLYGLLDPAEEAAVVAHLAECNACAAAHADAAGVQKQFAAAAKVPFPDVTFVVPAVATPAVPRAKPSRSIRWALAASLMIGTLGLLTPAVRDYAAYREQKVAVEVAQVELTRIEEKDAVRQAEAAATVRRLDRALADARESLRGQVKTWVSAEVRDAAQPFKLTVTGPVAATPGAANEYALDAAGAAVRLVVRDSRDTVFHQETLPPGTARWSLPAGLWAKFPAGAEDIVLAVSATNAAGMTAQLTEPIQLLAPVFTTLVVTDKPLYRPGEAVYFRSLTLNRTSLQPPTRDLTLRFELRKPDGNPIENGVVTGTTQPVLDRDGLARPVVGPDGTPVRGIACGVFALSDVLPGGEYTLVAFELPAGWASKDLPKGAAPVGTRKLTVAKYRPDVLQKTLEFDARTYGPGDTVRAKLTVKNQGQPVANVGLLVVVSPKPAALKQPGVLKADGTADIEFKLPAGELKSPTLTVNVLDENNETIVRPVPLASRTLAVEFFPEGGDLIEGVPNRVYVRATTTAGRPADVVGTITDGTRTVCDVKTLTDADHPGANQGLGVFTLTPEAGKRYALKLVRPAGTTEPAIIVPQLAGTGYLLPKADADGVALSIPAGVIDANQPVKATITAAKTKRSLVIGVYTRGLVVGHARLTAEPGKPTEVTIAPPPVAIGGVTRVTVFEEPPAASGRTDLVPLAERLIFRRPTEKLNLRFAPDKPGAYSPGDKVTLTVSATDEKDRPTAAVLLAAVVNQSVLTMADDKAERLLPTHFLLAGELQHPEQLEHADFLLTPHPRAAEALDLLLGTQGWRRFAEANGRFQSSSVSDAERQRFWIATGRQDPVGEGRPERMTEGHRAAVDPLNAKIESLEAEKLAAERERDRQPAAWAAVQKQLLAAKVHEQDTWEATERHLSLAAAGVTLLVFAGACYWMKARGKSRLTGGFLAFSVVALGLFAYFFIPAIQVIREANATKAALAKMYTPDERPTLVTGPDLRDDASKPITAVRVMLAPTPPRADIGPGGTRKVSESPPGRLQTDRADRAARSLQEGGPSPQEQAAFNDRVKAALTRHSPFVVREYAHLPKPDAGDGTRRDFTETVLWRPVLVLPGDGRATLDFHVSDAANAYRVLVAGHTLDGRLGGATGLVEVRKPLTVDAKLPPEVSSSDKLHLPVVLTNGTAKAVDAKVNYWSDYLVADDGGAAATVPAAGGTRVVVPVKPVGLGPAKVRVSAAGGDHADAVERTVSVVPDGFPVSGQANTELKGTAMATLVVPDGLIPGTLSVRLQVFTNSFADIESGLDGLLREPHGCFEQTSSSNYPNVLALQYLKDANRRDAAFAHNATGLLDRGYARLTGFEVRKPGGDAREGFEWFGAFPPHECLSAYGLVQFADMGRVFPVDPKIVERTKSYLLGRRDGKGGFTRKADAHGFGGVPDTVANAYLTWALATADPALDLTTEKEAAAAEALTSGDPYRLALAADAGPTPALLRALADKQKPDGSLSGAETSITRSRGGDLLVETTALAALAWIHAKSPDASVNVANAVGFLAKSRQPGGTFGGTQATVLALKAIVAYNAANRREPEAGEVVVKVDGKEFGRLAFKSDDLRGTVFAFDAADRLFPPGSHAVTLETTAKQAYPVSVTSLAFSRKLATAADAPLALAASLSAKDVTEGETVRLTVRVENREATDTGMAVAVVGLPAGLKLPPDFKQLKGLTAEAKVSYWEQTGRELVLYWRALGPKQAVDLSLDLIADVPGEFHGPAGRAYLYYHADAKTWIDPLTITIREK